MPGIKPCWVAHLQRAVSKNCRITFIKFPLSCGLTFKCNLLLCMKLMTTKLYVVFFVKMEIILIFFNDFHVLIYLLDSKKPLLQIWLLFFFDNSCYGRTCSWWQRILPIPSWEHQTVSKTGDFFPTNALCTCLT